MNPTLTHPCLSILVLLTSPFTAIAQPSTPNTYGYSSITPSMAIIIVVIITAFFLIGFLSLYFRQCFDSDSVRGLTNGGRSRRGAAAGGLEAAVIESFPILVYSEVKDHKLGKGALECAVCLCEFEDDETLRLLPKCDHVFHPECIDAWLASRTTCPVCRANLTPESGEPPIQTTESSISAENDVGEGSAREVCESSQVAEPPQPLEPPQIIGVHQPLNRNRTRGSRSGRPRWFPRSHSTGHSLVQPGENTDRFTLRLPVEVRKQIMNRELNRSTSLVIFATEGSSRKGYKTGGGLEGSSRGNYKRLDRLDHGAKSDRWVFNRTPSFLARASSFLSRASSSVRSTKFTANDGDGTSTRSVRPDSVRSGRPPV